MRQALSEDAGHAESLRRQLSEAEGNLVLIEEKKSTYVLEEDVPLQLIKNERHLRARIADLKAQLASIESWNAQ